MLKLGHLLRIDLASLEQPGITVLLVRLPGESTNVLGPERVSEHGLNLLERLAGGFGEGKEDMQEHGGVEDAEDDVDFPLNVDKRRWDEVAQSEVEDPIGRGGKRDGLAADAQGKELGWGDPAHGTPGCRIAGPEDEGAGKDGFGRRSAK